MGYPPKALPKSENSAVLCCSMLVNFQLCYTMLCLTMLYYTMLHCAMSKKNVTLQIRIEKNKSARIASLGNLSAHHTTLENHSPNNLQILLYFSKREIVQNKAFDLSHHIFDLRHFDPSNVHSIHPSKDIALDAKSG